MTDIEQKARELVNGFETSCTGMEPEPHPYKDELIKRIAAAIQSAIDEEREECAKLFCEFCRFTTSPAKYIEGNWYHYDLAHPNSLCKSAAIRARGQKVLDNNTNVR